MILSVIAALAAPFTPAKFEDFRDPHAPSPCSSLLGVLLLGRCLTAHCRSRQSIPGTMLANEHTKRPLVFLETTPRLSSQHRWRFRFSAKAAQKVLL
jgi:hypothetical protein